MLPSRLDANDFRDDVAAALDHDRVADLHAEALDLIFVVQRGAGNHDAADRTGFRCATGVKRACSADLYFDVLDLRFRLAARDT